MNILQEADKITQGDRREAYGHPKEFYKRAAYAWSAVLGGRITPEQVALCMVAYKVVRQAINPRRDNLTDIAGYARTIEMATEDEDEELNKVVDEHFGSSAEAEESERLRRL
jgi:hypothetical protein